MKKLLFALPVILLIAAGCNWSSISQPTSQNSQSEQQQQVAQNPSPDPTPTQTIQPTSTSTPIQAITSNIFTYKAKAGDKIGGMTLDKISANNSNTAATADNTYAEFSGTITLRGKLSAPTGNPEDGGMGPQYSLNDLTQDSLEKLPYLQSDTRTVWFGVKNQDVMQNFSVKNGDLVDMTINKYEYVFLPAGVWNQANVVSIKKIQ